MSGPSESTLNPGPRVSPRSVGSVCPDAADVPASWSFTMPCFSTSPPPPGTPEYEEWLPRVQRMFDAFAHVVDYYYSKAGFPMPHPGMVEDLSAWLYGDRRLPSDVIQPVNPDENSRVLRQILLHLDCDGVDVFQLNDLRIFLYKELTPKRCGYAFIVNYCFVALRNDEV